MATEGNVLEVPRNLPWYFPSKLRHYAGVAIKDYPVLWLMILFVVLIFPAATAPWTAPHHPLKQQLAKRLTAPVWSAGTEAKPTSWSNILGTDKQGRDILSRVMHGSRISLMVSLSALAIGGTVGTTLGLISGYFGGWVDHLIMRIVDVFLALPLILMALVIVAVFGPSFWTAIGVISVLLWSRYTRQIRAEVLSIKAMDFIARAKVAGASNTRIIIKHVFPNITNTLIVLGTLQVGTVILLEATLSFLGAGIPRPNPAWGVMVADGRDHIASAWWIAVIPGIAIMMTVLSMNMMGDWLRDKLDPKLRQV
jgi:peptide/nickel transport system permease protein